MDFDRNCFEHLGKWNQTPVVGIKFRNSPSMIPIKLQSDTHKGVSQNLINIEGGTRAPTQGTPKKSTLRRFFPAKFVYVSHSTVQYAFRSAKNFQDANDP
jgi:hypothetical protein